MLGGLCPIIGGRPVSMQEGIEDQAQAEQEQGAADRIFRPSSHDEAANMQEHHEGEDGQQGSVKPMHLFRRQSHLALPLQSSADPFSGSRPDRLSSNTRVRAYTLAAGRQRRADG